MLASCTRIATVILALMSTPFIAQRAQAQEPSSVDIDLRQSTEDTNGLEVYLRANGQPFGFIVSGLTFTLRWATTSTATLGTRQNNCPDAIAIGATPMVVDPLVDGTPTGYNYRSYNAFGLEFLSDYGCDLPADEWHLVMTVPVENATGCTEFNIVNDNWTDSPGNARDYYISLGGLDRTGVIDGFPVLIGDCNTPDCEGTAGGKALPGTPCDDSNAETINDTWTTECLCLGELSTGIGSVENAAIALWPNPGTGTVHVRAPSDAPLHVRISDVLGRMITTPITRGSGPGVWTLDISAEPAGLYLVELESAGIRSVQRVVKR